MPRAPRRQPLGWRMRLRRGLAVIRRRVPPGLRFLLGLLLIGLGFLGFLPVLGFWLIPLGIAVAALDIRALYRRLRGKPPRRPPNAKR